MKPLLEYVVVDEDFIRRENFHLRSELCNQAKHVFTMHLLSIVHPEDVIDLLLCQESVSIRVNLPECVHYLL